MRYLLDTHTFIWFINGDRQLPDRVKKIIKDIEHPCYLSEASLWEMAIKISLKKLKLKSDFKSVEKFLSDNYIEIIPFSLKHVFTLSKLAFHHRDPFDRFIISQAIIENMIILTRDEEFKKYKVKVDWQ